jgi:hypothetical protein
MTAILIAGGILATMYIYAAVTFYYVFKNWYPMCGTRLCTPGNICKASSATTIQEQPK